MNEGGCLSEPAESRTKASIVRSSSQYRPVHIWVRLIQRFESRVRVSLLFLFSGKGQGYLNDLKRRSVSLLIERLCCEQNVAENVEAMVKRSVYKAYWTGRSGV